MASPVLVDHVVVEFGAARAGDGPLTLGQRNTWQWMYGQGIRYQSMDDWVFPVPENARIADVVAAFAVLIERHESLRTTFHPIAGEVLQRVNGAGSLTVSVTHVDNIGAISASISQEMVDRLREQPFDPTNELPVRISLTVSGDRVLAAVAVFSHLAVDYGSMAVLSREFTELVTDPGARTVGPPRHHPLDRAAQERSPRGQRRAAAALRYWEGILRRAPQCLYEVPDDPGQDPGPLAALLSSHEASGAVDRITTRTGTSPAAVVLAAVSAVLSVRSAQRLCVFAALSSNRFGPDLRDYVGTLAQDGLVAVEVGGDTLDDLVRRTGTAVLQANRHSLFDVTDLVSRARRITIDRGAEFSRDCVFNNVGAHLADRPGEPWRTLARIADPQAPGGHDLTAAPAGTAVSPITTPQFPARLTFRLWQTRPVLVLALAGADGRYVPRAEIDRLLRATERLLLAAGAGPVPLDRVGEVAGITPVHRDPSWHRVDANWIRLAQVAALLDEALATPAHPVVEGGTLTAHLTATRSLRTPEQAHAACMAALPGRPATMAPQWYVLHEGTPADPTDLAAWQALPVRAAGSGREGPVPEHPEPARAEPVPGPGRAGDGGVVA
jgi:hypothetical protein